MLGGEFLERIGIAEGRADDDVVAALDEFLGRWRYLGGVLGDVLHEGNLHAERLLHLRPSLFEGLRPAAVILGFEVQKSHFGWSFERKPVSPS
jgi:hypothetical protein